MSRRKREVPRKLRRVARAKPYWTTKDRKAVKLYQGNVLDVLRKLPAQSVHMVMTSPPYWGLRDYGTDKTKELGSEKTPEEYIDRMVEIFSEVRRVLRNDGTVWLNLGDTYGGGSPGRNDVDRKYPGQNKSSRLRTENSRKANTKGTKAGNLVGIPWRVALALQADGWVLRQDIIWCLSGATWVYVRSQKGDMPMMIKDLARLDPGTVKMWDGKEWVQLLGVSRTPRDGREVKLTLRSGETISCSAKHKFPTKNQGLVKAEGLSIGDCLTQSTLPEPDDLKSPIHIDVDAAWLAGLYLAEGWGAENHQSNKFGLSGHRKEYARWNRVFKIVRSYGGHATLRMKGNNQTISIHGKVVTSIIRELIAGKTSKDKHFNPCVWKYSNQFLQSLMEGYLHGDGSTDKENRRIRLGFTRNHGLARDIRVACARLGWVLTLKPCIGVFDGREFPGFRGEIRKTRSGHLNEKDRCEITDICASHAGPGKFMYDVGVAGDSHLFTLASGVVTHNSKPNPMPEPVRNRCTKSHEYLFLLAKRGGYFYDAEAIKEKSIDRESLEGRTVRNRKAIHAANVIPNDQGYHDFTTIPEGKTYPTRNKRSVWSIPSYAYGGAHFATFPPKLVEPCILAGTSEMGCCPECGAPRKRVVETTREDTRPGRETKYGSVEEDIRGGDGMRLRRLRKDKTIGWEATCDCGVEESVPCVVLDPFVGSGTACCVAIEKGRRSIGIDLSEEYLREQAIPRINGNLLSIPKLSGLYREKE